MQPLPGRAEFLLLAAEHPVVPVTLEVLGDRETAVTVFEKLAGDGPAFLLESVEGGERWARWSFVGWDPAFTLLSEQGRSRVEGAGPEIGPGDPLEMLEDLLGRFSSPDPGGLPPLHSGAVGYLAYDMVRYIEDLPDCPPDDRMFPEQLWLFVGALAALDRLRETILLVRNVYVGPDPGAQYDAAVERLRADAGRLGRSEAYVPRSRPAFRAPGVPARASLGAEQYQQAVLRAIDYIRAGEAFQIVPSVRLEVPFDGDGFAIYRALRLLNPSPFLFFIRHPRATVVGSSPELMVRVRDGRVYSRPIAGTRPRGETADEDARLAEELLADPKERAEHVMLVDLARNDLGRVCEFGSVQVDDLMVVERYSHVQHIVSGVSGRLRDGVGPVDVVRATFPHGTVTGAPKVRAMQIIDELEPVARGPYAGAVGYLDFSGTVDTAIALRTLVAAGGKAWVQAGAGVVADSRPEAEYQECLNKAAAVLSAVEEAGSV